EARSCGPGLLDRASRRARTGRPLARLLRHGAAGRGAAGGHFRAATAAVGPAAEVAVMHTPRGRQRGAQDQQDDEATEQHGTSPLSVGGTWTCPSWRGPDRVEQCVGTAGFGQGSVWEDRSPRTRSTAIGTVGRLTSC